MIGANYYLVIKIIISTFAPLKPETIQTVDYLRQFSIPFIGLSTGNHQFEFEIDDAFFVCFENSDVRQAHVKISLDLDKQERMMVLQFRLNGAIRVTCDRCLEEFDFPVNSNELYFVKFGHEHKEEEDNVLVITENETHLDISQLLYDYLMLSLPYRIVHPEGEDGNSGCDPGALERIERLSADKPTDPRWDALKDLQTD